MSWCPELLRLAETSLLERVANTQKDEDRLRIPSWNVALAPESKGQRVERRCPIPRVVHILPGAGIPRSDGVRRVQRDIDEAARLPSRELSCTR